MDEWTDGQMDRWTDGWVDRQMIVWINVLMDRLSDMIGHGVCV